MSTDHQPDEALHIAQRWCAGKGTGWEVTKSLGQGGTAPVFEVSSPEGLRALKVYDAGFSSGKKGQIERKRIDQQLALMGHSCPYLVQVYEGGKYEDRLYLLMSRASGSELEKRLLDIPLAKIRKIVDQIAQAAIFLRSNGLCHRDIKSANIYISDDFDHCTLLDISVVREVTDPVGVGTDHDGQLPIVATARYSPPEYLFRLFEPSPELWHALTIYQLGALLHDLIMREPLFQAEYAKSTENRYRFAWIIATIDPVLSNDRIDRDLILTARRALDKNWQTRSSLRLEDFLATSDVEQEHSLQVLGLGIPAIQPAQPDPFADQLKRVREVAEELEIRVVQYLRDKGVRAVHDLQPGDTDVCKKISFRWNAMAGIGEPQGAAVCFQLSLRHISKQHGSYLEVMAKLEMIVNNKPTTVTLPLPEVRDEVGIESMLYEHAIEAFQRLAVEVIRVNVEAVEA